MSVASPEPKTVPEQNRYIGARSRKLKGDLFLTGKAQYINDVELPGMVHMSVLRSPHAHARIRGVDLSKAQQDTRCIYVIDGEEAAQHADPIPHFIDAAVFGGKHNDVRVLALNKVTYEGQPVAAVVARTRGDADALLDLIEVDYEPLPVVLEADEALAEGAPIVFDQDGWEDNVVIQIPFVEGDFEATAAKAAHRIDDEEFRIQRYSTQPIETRGYVASWDPRAETYTFHGSCQNPHPLRWVLSNALRVTEAQIRVIAPNVGGGFGLKMHGHPEEPLTCVLSRILERPVKWIEERDETLLIGAREHVHRFSVAFEDDGTIVAFKDHFTANVGSVSACPGWGMSFLTALSFPTGYKIPVTDIVVTTVATNKGPWNASRGYGKEGAQVVMERTIDLVAAKLGMDPADVRRKNFVDTFPFKTNSGLNIDSGDYHGGLDKALALLDYDDFRAEQERARGDGRHLGFGIAFELTPEAADIPGTLVGGYDTSTVKMDPSGKVTLLTGVTSPGSGNDGGIAQIVADTLGVELDDVQVVQGDTGICPYGFGNYSGRSMVVGGNSALLAARDVRAKLQTVAAVMLETDEDKLAFEGGMVTVSGNGGKHVPIKDVAYAIYTLAFATAHMVEPPLEATRVYKPENITHFPDEKGHIQPYPTYSFAVHVAAIELDPETGKVELRRFGVLHDCGNMINPTFVEGQMHGAAVMGLGAALTEEQKYDGEGKLLSNRFKTYMMIRAGDIPAVEMEHQITPSPFTLLGVKGAGEAGVGGAQAAVINAVNDALRPLGAQLSRSPASPPNVLAAMKGGQQ